MRSNRHGEYKVPGGKLVVVDLVVEEGSIRDAQVSGDFFLEPASALDGLTRALLGAPTDSEVSELAARLEASIDPGWALIGFTAESIAIATKRALQ